MRDVIGGRVWSILAACLATLALAACTAPSSSPSESAPGSATADPGTAQCAHLDLRTADGDPVDLTGTWRGIEATHYIRQDGSCVWWIAIGDDFPEQGQAAQVVAMFRGELAPDFTVTGEWMSVMRPSFISDVQRGQVTFDIDLEDPEAVILRATAPSGPYQSATLTFVGQLPRTVFPETP